MIKSKKGIVKIDGDKTTVLADLMIIFDALEESIDEGFFKDINVKLENLQDIVNFYIKANKEISKEG